MSSKGSTVPAARGSEKRHWQVGPFDWIWIALGVLIVACAFIAPSALTPGSVQAMLPFFSVLLLLSAGQTLIVQQRGIDMSVGTIATLAGLLVAQFTAATGSSAFGVILTIGLCGLLGTINGLLTTRMSISPIVATLATGTLLAGVARLLSGGSAMPIDTGLQDLVKVRLAGIPALALFAVGTVLLGYLVIRKTTYGRRFVGTGANVGTARALGTDTELYQVGTYALAGVLYGVAGFILAGYIGYATPTAGMDYLLPTIAVVVIGGTPFSGGRGSLVATIAAAAFMTLLDQMVLSMGARASEQLLTQAAAIVVATSLKRVSIAALMSRGKVV